MLQDTLFHEILQTSLFALSAANPGAVISGAGPTTKSLQCVWISGKGKDDYSLVVGPALLITAAGFEAGKEGS